MLINGKVEGKCYAARLSVLSKGIMYGDIFLTKFQLKKGSFIGCSQLMDPSSTKIEHAIEENDTDSELFITDIQSTLIPEDNSIK